MEANELRIGNYYQDNGKFFKVNINDLLNLVRHENTKYKSDMIPIPLTEEWLVKFGFTRKKRHRRWEYNVIDSYVTDRDIRIGIHNSYIMKVRGEYVLTVAPNWSHSVHLGKYKHVHQLQNLYFALTGEELTIK